MPLKLLIVDDHALVREGMRHVIQRSTPDVQILEADCSQSAQFIASTNQDIDLVLMDYLLPDGGGLELLRLLHSRLKQASIVIISMLEDTETVEKAISSGAKGFITKNMPCETLQQALQMVLSGQTYYPPIIASRNHDSSPSDQNAQLLACLTKRQHQILQQLSSGKTNKDIAKTLFISENTVRTHMTVIYRALNVTNRTEAAHIAHKMGLEA